MAQDRIELNTYTCTSKYATINWRYDSPILKAGAVCGSSARTDLCGGCRVTGIPTATYNLARHFSAIRQSPETCASASKTVFVVMPGVCSELFRLVLPLGSEKRS